MAPVKMSMAEMRIVSGGQSKDTAPIRSMETGWIGIARSPVTTAPAKMPMVMMTHVTITHIGDSAPNLPGRNG